MNRQEERIDKSPEGAIEHEHVDDRRAEKRRAEKELTPHKAAKHGRDEIIKSQDKIKVRQEDGDWLEATVLSRGGKATGKYDGYWNVEWEDSANRECINLKEVEYEKIEETPEEVHAVMVPKNRQKEPACLDAKQEELKKLRDFGTYEIVKDVGQQRISSTWVVCEKDDGKMKIG